MIIVIRLQMYLQNRQKIRSWPTILLRLAFWILCFGEGMKHYVNMVQEPEFAAREKGYTFVSHQQEVGAGYFDDVTTVIQGGTSSVKALTGSTEEEQFH